MNKLAPGKSITHLKKKCIKLDCCPPKNMGNLLLLISSVKYQCDNFGYKQCLQQIEISGLGSREWGIDV